MKPLTAIAVIKKSRPRLNILQIYSKKDVKEIWVGHDEEIIEVVITRKK